MGTDIHLAAEVMNDEGKWEILPGPVVKCWWCDGRGVNWDKHGNARQEWKDKYEGKPCHNCASALTDWQDDDGVFEPNDRYAGKPGMYRDSWYGDRNYNVFSVLADVRNGVGFAGVMTGSGFNIIADPRGVPEDASPEALRCLSDEHTPSWLMLEEIEAFDWDQTTTHCGWVNVEQYKVFKANGQPDNWSGDIWGDSVQKVTVAAMEAMLNDNLPADPDNLRSIVTHVEWEITYRDVMGNFLERMAMLRLEAGDRPCRIVFDFDS